MNQRRNIYIYELARDSIGLGKALSRACITSSRCFNRSKFLEAAVVASTRLSYPLFLFHNPAIHFFHARLRVSLSLSLSLDLNEKN